MKTASLARVAAFLAVVAAPLTAAAQEPSPASAGPLIVERVPNGFVVAPDYKVTDFDDKLGQLAGVYAGRVMGQQLLIGGAAYWLVNGADAAKLTYGGLLIGWSTSPERRIQFGGRALAGIGRATIGLDLPGASLDRRPGPGPGPSQGMIRFGGSRTQTVPDRPGLIRVRAQDDFFVLEPQGNVVLKLTDHLGLSCAAGYRLAAMTEVLGDRLQGVTGSLGIQLGW